MLAHRTHDDRSSGGNGRGSGSNEGVFGGGGVGESLSGNTIEEYRIAARKVELPLFDGSEPVGWVTRAETYFELQNVSDENKVRLTKLSMEGSTIHWFNLWQETEDHSSWPSLKQALVERYGSRHFVNPFEELSDLRQNGSLEEFISKFEYLSAMVGRLPEAQYLGYFMGGLQPELRRRVRTFNPCTRLQMMHVARDVEAELERVTHDRKSVPNRLPNHSWGNRHALALIPSQGGNVGANLTPRGGSSSTLSLRSGKEERKSGVEQSRGVKHLSYQELMERKAKGLYFRCGEKFHPMHQCTERQLQLLVLGDDEIIEEEEVEATKVDVENIIESLECNAVGVGGINQDLLAGAKTMRMEGRIKEVHVLVMIDSGASLNFISSHVMAALDLRITPTQELRICLGDGHQVLTRGKCSNLILQLDGSKFVVDAYVLELGGLDLILGVAWLKGLGKVVMDWKEMTMDFLYHGEPTHLRGVNCGLGLIKRNKVSCFDSSSFNNLLQQGLEEDERNEKKNLGRRSCT